MQNLKTVQPFKQILVIFLHSHSVSRHLSLKIAKRDDNVLSDLLCQAGEMPLAERFHTGDASVCAAEGSCHPKSYWISRTEKTC